MRATIEVMLPADNHVHSRWSWDTAESSTMERECEQALRRGIPAVAFTEHVDFTDWGAGDPGSESSLRIGDRPGVAPFDVEGYRANIARCRRMFPGLRVLSGIEAGEPHHFSASVTRILASGDFDRVLGSLHGIECDGTLQSIDSALFADHDPHELMERYFTDMVTLVERSQLFSVLAHCDYPRRYWPGHRVGPYREADYEEHYRTVFSALAPSQRALEVNTKSPLHSVELVRWWYQQGGEAVSFGSDAHRPDRVGDQFELAVDIVEAAGFRPGRDRFDFWRR
ncbi:MAG: PHP domain-containing protein [Actinomycetota bacterium]|nr:PHP domain-containing protein [Actinomycetota bacterium]